jgi:DNA-binding MarR family transcriptional regulator
MTPDPDMITTRAWTRLLKAQTLALSRVEAALKQADLPPLSWYDALLELERGPEDGLRPKELEEKLLLPQYGLSRLLDRLEKAGYVARRPIPEDGRAQCVTLTPEGRDIRGKMWPVYASAIEAAIGQPLSEEERTVLGIILGKLIKND